MSRVRLCKTMVQPIEVKVASQSKAETYTVIPSTVWNDAICSCPGFHYRGQCKHVDSIESSLCSYVTNDLSGPLSPCPDCGSSLVEFEFGPEFDEG